jgi:hypothetical protein
MNEEIKQKIIKAERSEGFIIMISSRNNGKLNHYYMTRNFLRDDIPIAIDKLEELLSKEIIKSTDSKETLKKPTKLPPEYRK